MEIDRLVTILLALFHVVKLRGQACGQVKYKGRASLTYGAHGGKVVAYGYQ